MTSRSALAGVVFAFILCAAGPARAQEGEAKKGDRALQQAEEAARAILAQDDKICGAGKALVVLYQRLFVLQDQKAAKEREVFRIEKTIKDKVREFREYGSQDAGEQALLKKTDEEVLKAAEGRVSFYSSNLSRVKELVRAMEEAQFEIKQIEGLIKTAETKIEEHLAKLPKEISQARPPESTTLPALAQPRGKRVEEGCGNPEYEKYREPVPECRGGCP